MIKKIEEEKKFLECNFEKKPELDKKGKELTKQYNVNLY